MDISVAFHQPLSSEPLTLLRPKQQTVPLIFVSAHSGRNYLPDFLAESRLDLLSLRRSEDSFVDELFASAPRFGAPLLLANFPRAFCDVNREAWELDPAMFEDALPPFVNAASARVLAGLGVIPRIVASGEPIYARKLRFDEALFRIREFWQPFHASLAELIHETTAIFGACLVVDCHSMPTIGETARHRVEFVLGDAHGTSCASGIAHLLESKLAALGYTVRRNNPYAGGYITRHYGRPETDVHAIQIEIARALYMNEITIEKLPSFEDLKAHMDLFIANLTREIPPLLERGL